MMRRQDGFTLTELLIMIVMITIFTTTIMVFTVNYWRYGYMLQLDLETLGTRLNAGDFLREAIGSSSGLVIQNSITDANTGNPDPNQGSGTYWLPIHAIPKTITMGGTGTATPVIYFRRPSLNSSGNYIMNGTQPYEDEYVLYLDGTTKALMQRSLANPNASGNRLKTSCPASLATSTCPADKTIASDVASVDTRYFSRTGNLIDYTAIWDDATNSYAGPDYPAVEVVEFTIKLSRQAATKHSDTTINSTIIRVALRNG